MSEIKQTVRFFGRIFEDIDLNANFFNWTCSGFEFAFFGTCLEAELIAFESNFEMLAPKPMWPWVAVFLDDEEEPVSRFIVSKEKDWYTLFKSDVTENHRIKVVKLTENNMGKLGITKMKVKGEVSSPKIKALTCKLEFIGDSITCGYGNEAEHRDDLFEPKEENGWVSYGALVARQMNAEYRSVSMSGISVSHGSWEEKPYRMPSMDEIYEYADRLYEERRGRNSHFKKWDFSSYATDFIIVNLGTNDVNAIKLAKDKKAEEQLFEQKYINFLKKIREMNGSKAIIYCTLGPLDYYLYDNIKRSVDSYQQQSNDIRIHCFKYGGVLQPEEGYGAVGHPSTKTHLRMSKELSAELHKWLEI